MRVLVLNRFSLSSARYQDWTPHDVDVHLITTPDSIADPRELAGYGQVRALADYRHGGAVGVVAEQMNRQQRFDRVIAASEYDVLTAARLSEHWGLPTRPVEEVRRYRDKAAMKAALDAAGVPVTPWAIADDAVSVLAAVQSLGLPAVVKPRRSAGSRGVHVLRTSKEVEAFVRADAGLGADRPADLLVERYVAGASFHVDGFVRGGAVIQSWPSESTPNLEITRGRPLVSSMLDPTDSRREALCDLTERAITALGPGDVGLFHAEVFEADPGRFLINEIGARLGGGRIKEVLRRAFGVDPLEWWVRSSFGGADVDPTPRPLIQVGYAKSAAVAGRVEVAPTTCPVPGITSYYPGVAVGDLLDAPSSSDDCTASFVATAQERSQVVQALCLATQWAGRTYRIAPLA